MMTHAKFSFNATTLRNFSAAEAMRLVRAAGYEGVEIALNDAHLHPLTSTKQEVRAVRELCENIGLQIACVAAGGPNLLGDEAYEPSMVVDSAGGRMRRLDAYKKSIELAQQLGCPVVNINSGMLRPDVAPEAAQEHLLIGIHQLLPTLGNETTLVLEPEPNFFVGTTTKAIEVIEIVGSPKLRLNLDIGHVFCSEEDCYNNIAKALPYTRHIHIEDIKERIHHHEIPGEGDIHFGVVMNTIRDSGYSHFVSVELHHHDQMWARALNESRDYLLHLEALDQIA